MECTEWRDNEFKIYAQVDPTGEPGPGGGTGGWLGLSGKAWLFRAAGLWRDSDQGDRVIAISCSDLIYRFYTTLWTRMGCYDA